MRSKMMFLLMIPAAAACGDMNRAATEFTPSADRLATAATDELPPRTYITSQNRGAATDASPQTTRGSAALEPVAGGRLRATVRLKSLGGMTSVATTLSGGAPEATYAGYLRQGTCSQLGPTLGSLVPASTDTLGSGRSDSDLSIPLDSLAGGPHVIVFGRSGSLQTCGAVRGLAPAESDIRQGPLEAPPTRTPR